MNTQNGTIAIYGIQDIQKKSYPVYIHDHNVAFYREGKIQKYLHLERFTRKKYDHRLNEFLYSVLREENLLSLHDIDRVFVDHVAGRSFINKEGNLRFEAPLNKELSDYPEEGRFFVMDHTTKAWAVNHELAHVYSNLPFYGDFEENSLHVHFDGGASKSNFSAWLFKDGKMRLLEYHWDMKYLSALFNANALTFSIIGSSVKDQNSMPGKFMGFSSYGEYDPEIEKWLKDYNYFADIWGNKRYFFNRLREDWKIRLKHFNQKDPFIQNIAATIQHIFERDLAKELIRLRDQCQSTVLYYSGGSALNIKANSKIWSERIFDRIYIPPCTNDSGLSIGAGAFVEWIKHGKVKNHQAYLNNWLLNDNDVVYSEKDINELVSLLSRDYPIGICNGWGEAGPRALGNRSIIARADSARIATYVSRTVKGREWYRPVAPVMLAKNFQYFTGCREVPVAAKFMLMDFPVIPERRNELEGCIHVDGTSRIQVIQQREDNAFLYDLLIALESQKGMKALLNTSFNARGMPIVHTEKDALDEARAMELNYLVLNGKLTKLNVS